MNKFFVFLKKFGNGALDVMFPDNFKCILCGRDLAEDGYFCKDCLREDIFNDSNRCVICDTRVPKGNIICNHCKSKRSFKRCVCPLNMDGNVKRAILKFKDDNARYLVSPFANLVAERLKKDGINFDVIVPVPSHKKSVKKRGYNPPELIALRLGEIFNKPVLQALEKTVYAKKQKKLDYEKRQANLFDTITLVNKDMIKDKVVLIVDDVVTTGATMNTCAALMRGAKEVFCCGIARRNLIGSDERFVGEQKTAEIVDNVQNKM